MIVYVVMYYDKPNGIWQIGGVYKEEKDAKVEANHYNLIYGDCNGFVLPKTLQ